MPATLPETACQKLPTHKPRTFLTPETLRAVPLTHSEWTYFSCFKEDWQGWEMEVGGWGRMVDDKHVCVVLNRCGDYHVSWRIYVNGDMVKALTHIHTLMGSGRNAIEATEAWLRNSGFSSL